MTRIHFNEVVTRDGFQIEPEFINTDTKVALIDALSLCGFAKIEVTSFTSAKAIPMLRDAEAVMGRIRRLPGVEYTVLVPNVRGAERALESRADELNLVMSISETHNLANLRMAQALQACHAGLQLALHFHNTRGMGLANLLAAVQAGMTRFDGSLGGLGGCPYAPGASGNICSEDAIHMLQAMGYDTGIDVTRLMSVARGLPAIVNHEVPGQLAKAGLITDLHAAPPSVAELRATCS